MPFTKNMGKNISKSVSENVSGKCSQSFLDHANQSATDPCKTASNILVQKAAEVTRALIGEKALINLQVLYFKVIQILATNR